MRFFLQYFLYSVVVTIAAVILGYLMAGPQGVATVLMLGVLETSLSFDNAVLNATKLKTMNKKGRKWFLSWGMIIAVGGMRLVFPILIVMAVGHMGFFTVFDLAIHHPAQYAAILQSSHHQVAAFGGAFLLMVFLKFMLDHEKDSHWISWIEAPLSKIGKLDMIQSVLTLGAVLIASMGLATAERLGFVEAGVIGLIVYILVDGLGELLQEYDEAHATSAKQVLDQTLRAAIPGLLYLEVLDASMSFDGVIGAFALSDNIFIIMAGLAVGAMFVRSLTNLLVEKDTLATFRYLEHGAFWAIGALATTMMLSVAFEVPEVVTGLIGVFAIGAALISSIVANRRGGEESEEEAELIESDGQVIEVPDQITVFDLSQKLGVKAPAIVRMMFENMSMNATINQVIDRSTALEVSQMFGFQTVLRRQTIEVAGPTGGVHHVQA